MPLQSRPLGRTGLSIAPLVLGTNVFGWTVDEACIFIDDGISGAEFSNRRGFLRLMNTLKPRPPFQERIRFGRSSQFC